MTQRPSQQSVTMADVAARAGVSTATVSRALSGTRPMSAELRATVLRVAEELGYRVNLLGRALRQQRTSTVGLIVPDLDNPFFSSLAQHLSRTFETSEIDLLVFSADDDLRIERRGVQSFLGRQVEALVMIPCHEVESEESVTLAARSTVTIQLDRFVAASETHYVGCDNRYGMRLIRDHVSEAADLEAQPLVYVGATTGSSSGHERLDGFHRSFGQHPSHLGSFDVTWGQRAADLLLDEGFDSATVVTAADVIALGLLGRLLARGRRVPEDFRVIGFDGVGVSRLAYPTLTTVRQPVEAFGRTILELIADRPQTGDGPEPAARRVRLRPELVIGQSSPPRPPV